MKFNKNCTSSTFAICALMVALFSPQGLALSDGAQALVEEGVARTEDNQAAQQQVNKIHNQTLSLIEQYGEKLKVVEGLNAYNQMMKRQRHRQTEEMDVLRESINDVSIIERQVMPLLDRMLDGLDEFIVLDMPFLLQERQQRVVELRNMLERVDVNVAEKTRRVFEAYQIENEYGRTIESYRNKLELDGGVYDVDFLRVGRTSLMYRVVGSEKVGYWNKHVKRWQTVEEPAYRRYFEQGLKIAKREMAPELIIAPVVLSGVQ